MRRTMKVTRAMVRQAKNTQVARNRRSKSSWPRLGACAMSPGRASKTADRERCDAADVCDICDARPLLRRDVLNSRSRPAGHARRQWDVAERLRVLLPFGQSVLQEILDRLQLGAVGVFLVANQPGVSD